MVSKEDQDKQDKINQTISHPPSGRQMKSQGREERLAQNLKANLQRRKARSKSMVHDQSAGDEIE